MGALIPKGILIPVVHYAGRILGRRGERVEVRWSPPDEGGLSCVTIDAEWGDWHDRDGEHQEMLWFPRARLEIVSGRRYPQFLHFFVYPGESQGAVSLARKGSLASATFRIGILEE